MRKQLVTDVRTNSRIYLPRPRSVSEEAELQVRGQIWKMEADIQRNEDVDEDGKMKRCNLTASAKRGLNKLLGRIKTAEIVVGVSDKSKELVISSIDNYIEKGRVHVGEDEVVHWGEVRRTQRIMNGHSRMLIWIIRIGESQGEKNEDRIRSAYTTDAEIVPDMST